MIPYAGCVHQGPPIRGDVANSRPRESDHGTGDDCLFSPARHHRMAAAPPGFWPAGFCVSKASAGGVCGWMLLARVPAALPDAVGKPGVLAGKTPAQPTARPAGSAHAAIARLARAADLGARAGKAKRAAAARTGDAGVGGEKIKSRWPWRVEPRSIPDREIVDCRAALQLTTRHAARAIANCRIFLYPSS